MPRTLRRTVRWTHSIHSFGSDESFDPRFAIVLSTNPRLCKRRTSIIQRSHFRSENYYASLNLMMIIIDYISQSEWSNANYSMIVNIAAPIFLVSIAFITLVLNWRCGNSFYRACFHYNIASRLFLFRLSHILICSLSCSRIVQRSCDFWSRPIDAFP